MRQLITRTRVQYRLYRFCGFSRRYAGLRSVGVSIALAERADRIVGAIVGAIAFGVAVYVLAAATYLIFG